MPTLPVSARATRLPQSYRPPGTSSISPAPNFPGQFWRRNAAGNSGGGGTGNLSTAGHRRNYVPPRATGTYKAAPAPPPATYGRGGIPASSYNHQAAQAFNPTPPPNPIKAAANAPYGTPTRPNLPGPAISPRPAPVPRAARGVPRGIGGRAISGGAGVAVGAVFAAGSTLAAGGSVQEAIGAGVGAGVGSVAGFVAGAAVGSLLGPAGTAIGGYVGSAIGGYVGSGIGQAIGNFIDGPDIPQEAIAGPQPGTIPFNPLEDLPEQDLTPYGGLRVQYFSPNNNGVRAQNVSSFRFEPLAESSLYHNPGVNAAIYFTQCGGTQGSSVVRLSTFGVVQQGVCEPPSQPLPAGQPAHPARVAFPAASAAATPTPASTRSLPPVTVPQPRPVPPSPQPVNPTSQPPGPALAPTPQLAPSPGVVISPGSAQQSGRVTESGVIQSSSSGTSEFVASPETPLYWRELPNGDIETWQYPAEGITEDTEIPEWVREQNPEIEQVPQPGTSKLPALAPVPIPLGRPATGVGPKGAVGTSTLPRTEINDSTTNKTTPPTPPKAPIPTSTAGNCGCNTPMLKNQQLILNQMGTQSAGQTTDLADVKARLTRIEGNQNNPAFGFAALQGGQVGILAFLQTMNNFIRLAWEKTRIQKVLDVLTFIGVMHNVALLSRDVGETFGWVAGQALNVVGIEDEEGNTIDVYGWFTSSIESLLRGMFGDELYEDGRETWLKASAIVRSASMIIWTMRGIMDATQDLMEWVAENTGRIGNALKRFGVVGERAYPWMSERAQARNRVRARFDKVTGTLENAEDMASSFSMATGNVLEIQQETGELGQQWSDFTDTVTEAIPDPWSDNVPVATSTATEAANAQSPDIQNSDTARGN